MPDVVTETITVVEPTTDGSHERFTHIVLEAVKVGEEVHGLGNSVVEATVYGTPVEALCGKRWVPGQDPKRYPLCPTCKEIATQRGWRVPA